VVEDNSIADFSDLEDIVKETVNLACININAMRKVEGEKLVSDLLSKMDNIEALVGEISKRAPFVATEYKEKLQVRIEEALKDVKYDQTRLLQEVAFFTDKVNMIVLREALGIYLPKASMKKYL
jgi:uncharacterized protein YicC (UPF0701 family)